MKKLINIHSNENDKNIILAGNCAPNGDVYINIEFAWDQTRTFNKFIKYFAKLYEHEIIHRLINDELGKRKINYLMEDIIVRKLTGEKLLAWQEEYYKAQNEEN